LLNYAVHTPLYEAPIAYTTRGDARVEPHPGVTLVVPLPKGFEPADIAWYAPGQVASPLHGKEVFADGVFVQTPELPIYSLVVVKLKPVSAALKPRPVQGMKAKALPPMFMVKAEEQARLELLSPESPATHPPGVLTLRSNHHLFVRLEQGEDLKGVVLGHLFESGKGPKRPREVESVDVVPVGGMPFSRGEWVRYWVIDPAGAVVQCGGAPCGRECALTWRAQQAGVHTVFVDAGSNTFELKVENRAASFACLDTNRLFAHQMDVPLHFYVRRGAKALPLNLSTYDKVAVLRLTSPKGRVVEKPLSDCRVMAPVGVSLEPGEDGGIWRMDVRKRQLQGELSTLTLFLDDPDYGYVSTAPGRLLGVMND
jgi:hypothetical protein